MGKVLVKKAGGNYTVNMKTTGGKIIAAAIAVFIIACLVFVVIAVTGGGNSISFAITGQTAEIKASGFGGSSFTFSTNDITSVSMINTFPEARRTNGTSNQKFLFGRFNVTGYDGSSNVYIHRDNSPYIVVDLVNGRVFLNGETRDETERFYNQLTSAMPTR